MRVEINGSCVLKRGYLLLNALDNFWGAVTTGHRHNSREHVQIPPACFVAQPLHVPIHDHDGILVHREYRGMHVLSAHSKGLFS